MKPKTIHKNTITGELGVALIHTVVTRMGFMWNATTIDAGIDGDIEIRDPKTGEATNCTLRVQSKAVEKSFDKETDEYVDYYCKPRDIAYWLRGSVPTIFVLSRPSTNEAFWVSIREYFGTAEQRKSSRIRFSKTADRFDVDCAEALISLAVPRDRGVYSSALAKEELLYSNLLPVVELPSRVYRAPTEITSDKVVFAKLRDAGVEGITEFFLKEHLLVTVHDLKNSIWAGICDQAAVESDTFSTMTDSEDEDIRRDAVRLMNYCLSQKLRRMDFRWSKDDKCYYYRPYQPKDRPAPVPQKLTTNVKGISRESQKALLDVYHRRNPETGKREVARCRHAAARLHFEYFDDQWYLEVTPTYYFTRDGHKRDRWGFERLKGIKKLEKQKSVFSHMVMWSDLLTRTSEGDMFATDYSLLKLASMATFDCPVGIPEERWKPEKDDDLESKLDQLFAE